MDGYRIGEVADFLGLSSESLRHYEREGVMRAKRNPESGYRYYNAWDINYLMDCTYYRAFGFSMDACREIINDADLDQLIKLYKDHSLSLLNQIRSTQIKLDETKRFLEQLQNIRNKLGRFSFIQSPEIFFQAVRRNNELFIEQDDIDSYEFWNRRKPIARNTFLIFTEGSTDFSQYYWGYSLETHTCNGQEINALKKAEHVPSYNAAYSVFCAYEEDTFLKSFYDQIIQPLKERECHVLKERVIGNLLARVHENGRITRYCEVWVPIE